ncbi:hypothetical protein M0811_12804 [Anaeramoeba ignava]|uniref:Uncharacterized protein n=1 Tax=Anaeramoeba ignava TaxID=1746090 RepID=A0A9Q0R650_ANAIG|nr:hypothetical protein M0811_12804 [Anaeramoeba ignava]
MENFLENQNQNQNQKENQNENELQMNEKENILENNEKQMMIDKISKELIERLFCEESGYQKIYICKPSQKAKKLIYLTLEENINEKKCNICGKRLRADQTHFQKIRERNIQKYRKEIEDVFQKFGEYLIDYSEFISQKFILEKETKGNFEFQLIDKFEEYLKEKGIMFSMMNMENMFYLIHEKMLRNLFSIIKENQEYQQELLEFIDKKMSEKNLKIIRTNPENAILYSCVKVINEDEKLQKIIISNNNNNKQLSKENKPTNIIVAYIQDGFPLSKIIKFIRKRNQCLNNPKKFTSSFKNSLSKKTGQEWLKFIFNEIEKSKGRLQLIHFIQNEIPEKLKNNSISQSILLSIKENLIRINIQEKKKETSLLYYYGQRQMGNDLSTQFQKSHVSFPSEYNTSYLLSKIYSHFWNIEKQFESKEVFKMAIHSIEFLNYLKLEPFGFLFSSDLLFEVGEEGLKKEKLENLYWPTMGSHPFNKEFRKETKNWKICEKGHLNFIKFSKLKLQNWCEFCKSKLQEKEIKQNFFENLLSYSVSKFPNENIGYTLREMNPITFRIIRLLMHLSIISVSIISDKFSNFFIQLINNCVFKPKSKEELIQQLFGHIQNDLTILSKLINTPINRAIYYFHETLNILLDLKIPKLLLNKDFFKETEARNSFETFFNNVVNEKHQFIMNKIKNKAEDPIWRKLQQKSQKLNLFDLPKPDFYSIINLFYQQKTTEKKDNYPLIEFIISNQKNLMILNLFEGFMKFANFLIKKLTEKIKKEKSNQITIKELIEKIKKEKSNQITIKELIENEKEKSNQITIKEIFENEKEKSNQITIKELFENEKEKSNQITIKELFENEKEDVQEYFSSFKKFWELIISEVKYLMVLKDIKNESNIPIKINEINFIDYCLTEKKIYNLMISIFIDHSINIHNEMIESPLLQNLFQKLEEKEKEKEFSEIQVDLPFLETEVDFTKFVRFDFEEFSRFIYIGEINNELNLIEEYIFKKLSYLKKFKYYKNVIEDFQFLNEKPEIKTEFLETEEWKQEKLKKFHLFKIKEELTQNNLNKTILELIKFVISSCKRINMKKNTEEKRQELREMGIMDFFQKKIESENFTGINQAKLIEFSKFVKLKHLLFIWNDLKIDFETVLENLPEKFRIELTSFQALELENSIKKMKETNQFFEYLKEFLIKLNDNINPAYSFRDLFLFSIEEKESNGYKEIEEKFDIEHKFLISNSLEIFKSIERTLRKRTN